MLGVGAGFLLARAHFPGRNLLDTLLTLPMVMPPTVLGHYLLVLIGRRSALGSWLHDTLGINLIFSWQGAVLATSVVVFPLVFKPARAAFENVDPQLEQAARVLLLDEPLAALDPDLRTHMRAALLALQQQLRVPMILITHDTADAEHLGQHIISLHEGRVIRHAIRCIRAGAAWPDQAGS